MALRARRLEADQCDPKPGGRVQQRSVRVHLPQSAGTARVLHRQSRDGARVFRPGPRTAGGSACTAGRHQERAGATAYRRTGRRPPGRDGQRKTPRVAGPAADARSTRTPGQIGFSISRRRSGMARRPDQRPWLPNRGDGLLHQRRGVRRDDPRGDRPGLQDRPLRDRTGSAVCRHSRQIAQSAGATRVLAGAQPCRQDIRARPAGAGAGALRIRPSHRSRTRRLDPDGALLGRNDANRPVDGRPNYCHVTHEMSY